MMKLLSGKPLADFNSNEFKQYVRGLFFKRAPRKSAKKKLPPFRWRKNPKGTLIVKVNRDWISEEEVKLISMESGAPLNEVWLKIFHPKKGSKRTPPRLSTAEDEKRITSALASLPW
jgi:hypothetical protein